MFEEDKNLKDSATNLGINMKDNSIPVSYKKTNKLITALYMVTDTIDKDEPLRNKLRTLGTEIISDIHIAPSNILVKISQVMSFLDIASTVNIISEMNCTILKKEFLELKLSLQEQTETKPTWLEEFLIHPQSIPDNKSLKTEQIRTRIGVQRGSTLMKALSGVEVSDKKLSRTNGDSFNILKKQRRDNIINIIKNNTGSATITDIKNKAQGSLLSCSEKTLQRELMSMIKDDVLYKTGEKRWSKYFIPKPLHSI